MENSFRIDAMGRGEGRKEEREGRGGRGREEGWAELLEENNLSRAHPFVILLLFKVVQRRRAKRTEERGRMWTGRGRE